MTNTPAMDVFSRAKAQPQGTERPAPKPVSGVTDETFWTLAKSFFAAAGTGFVLIRDAAWATTEFPHTPREWGAWLAYFDSKGIPHRVIDHLGKGTVPAQFPHLFDANWEKKYDDHAADQHVAKLRRETRVATGVVDAAARKTFITNRLGYDPAKRRGVFNEPTEEQAPMLIDKDLLLECYDADMAALQAKKDAKERAA